MQLGGAGGDGGGGGGGGGGGLEGVGSLLAIFTHPINSLRLADLYRGGMLSGI